MPSGTCSRRFDAGGAGTSPVVAAVTPFRSPWGVAGIGPAAAALWHGGRLTDIRWLHAGHAICSEPQRESGKARPSRGLNLRGGLLWSLDAEKSSGASHDHTSSP